MNVDTPLGIVAAILLAAMASLGGFVVWLLGWQRQRAGVLLGLMAMVVGLVVCFVAWRTLPRYWWVGVPACYIGFQAVCSWRQQEQAKLRTRLSSLLVFVGFIAIMLAGVGRIYRQGAREHPIASRLRAELVRARTSGEVREDWDGIVSAVILYEVDAEQERRIFDLVSQLTAVRLLQVTHYDLSPDSVDVISELSRLEELYLQGAGIDEVDLQAICRLTNLRRLDLLDNQITSRALTRIARMKRLEQIWYPDSVDDQEFRRRRPDLAN